MDENIYNALTRYRYPNSVNLYHAVVEFYTCQAALLAPPPKANMQKLKLYANAVTRGLANVIYNYIIVASAGEARHSVRNGRFALRKLYPLGIYVLPYRAAAVSGIFQYDRDSLIEALEVIFSDNNWQGKMGGATWMECVQILRYYNVSKVLFIDAAVNMQHNTGTLFSKDDYGIIETLDPDKFRRFLDYRREAAPEELLQRYLTGRFSTQYSFLSRTLGVDYVGLFAPKHLLHENLIEFGSEEAVLEEISQKHRTVVCVGCKERAVNFVSTPLDEDFPMCGYCSKREIRYWNHCLCSKCVRLARIKLGCQCIRCLSLPHCGCDKCASIAKRNGCACEVCETSYSCCGEVPYPMGEGSIERIITAINGMCWYGQPSVDHANTIRIWFNGTGELVEGVAGLHICPPTNDWRNTLSQWVGKNLY